MAAVACLDPLAVVRALLHAIRNRPFVHRLAACRPLGSGLVDPQPEDDGGSESDGGEEDYWAVNVQRVAFADTDWQ
jgi:hypothetical protein